MRPRRAPFLIPNCTALGLLFLAHLRSEAAIAAKLVNTLDFCRKLALAPIPPMLPAYQAVRGQLHSTVENGNA